MDGRRVLVLANLKAKKLGGFPSQGMVLCASNDAHDVVKFVDPPADAPIGALVSFAASNPAYTSSPASATQVAKKKIFEKVAPDLQVGAGGVCFYKGTAAFAVEGCAAPCTAPPETVGFHIA